MIWGVGTGRCGTKSLAKHLKGEHEPKPWFTDRPRKWYDGTITVQGIRDLENAMKARAKLDTPIIVDFKQSYIMDYIISFVDPDASFIWVIREPVACVSSMVAGKWYGETDGNGENLLTPPDSTWDRFIKCIWYYNTVNEEIYRHKDHIKAVHLTEELPVWENKYPIRDTSLWANEKGLHRWREGSCDIYTKALELKQEISNDSTP